MKIKVKGLDDINAGFRKSLKKVTGRVLKGLVKGGLVIKRESMLKTPTEYGNLVGSTYMVWTGGKSTGNPQFNDESGVKDKLVEYFNTTLGAAKRDIGAKKNPIVEFGFGAFYGIYVHEDLEAHHRVGTSKFLEKAARESRKKVLQVIKDEASRQ